MHHAFSLPLSFAYSKHGSPHSIPTFFETRQNGETRGSRPPASRMTSNRQPTHSTLRLIPECPLAPSSYPIASQSPSQAHSGNTLDDPQLCLPISIPIPTSISISIPPSPLRRSSRSIQRPKKHRQSLQRLESQSSLLRVDEYPSCVDPPDDEGEIELLHLIAKVDDLVAYLASRDALKRRAKKGSDQGIDCDCDCESEREVESQIEEGAMPAGKPGLGGCGDMVCLSSGKHRQAIDRVISNVSMQCRVSKRNVCGAIWALLVRSCCLILMLKADQAQSLGTEYSIVDILRPGGMTDGVWDDLLRE